MRTEAGRAERHQAGADATPSGWEPDIDLDAWTLDELDDELGSLRPAFAETTGAGG